MSGARRVPLSASEARAVEAGRFVRVELGGPVRLPDGLQASSAFVGRVDGRLVAFANRCQHTPVPLDAADVVQLTPDVCGAPMADDGVHFMCHSHGALYRPSDGFCVLGPCFGQKLFPLDVEDRAPALALVVRD